MPKRAKKIFGIGLSKTGTTSLHHAFELLGLRSVHEPFKPQLLTGDYRCFDEIDAACDVPVVPFYPQLDQAYPGSKFILTVRDLPSWLNAMERLFDVTRNMHPFPMAIRTLVYGVQVFHEDRLKWAYEKHVREVKGYFRGRSKDLLVLRITDGEGWEKLCPFLGLPVPKVPFPKSWSPGSRGPAPESATPTRQPTSGDFW
jgi:hypothetical protein